MIKRKIVAIILFNFIGLFLFTYIGPDNSNIKDLQPNIDEPVFQEEINITEKIENEIEIIEMEEEKSNNNKKQETTKNETPKIKTSNIILSPENIVILLGDDYNLMEGLTIDSGRNLEVSTNIIDTKKLSVGKHEIIYSTTDINGEKVTAKRLVTVLHPEADEDNDGYTNEEEAKANSDFLNEDNIPTYSKELTFDLSKCTNNMTVYDEIPNLDKCAVATHEFYGTKGININIDASKIDKNNIGTYKVKIIAEDILKNKSEAEFNFNVYKRKVNVVIDDKTSIYLEDIKEFTSNEKEVTIAENDIGINLHSDVTNISDVGSYAITGTWENKNYDVTFINGEYLVTPKSIEKLTKEEVKQLFNIKFDGLTTTYNGEEQRVLINGSLPSEIDVQYINNKGISSGTYNAEATLVGTKNYSGNTTLNANLTINKAPITLKAEDKEIIYGNNAPQLTYEILNGQIFNNDDLKINLTRDSIQNNNVGTYEITITAENNNYDINLINGTYIIKKAKPEYTIPTGLIGEEDMTLSEIPLPNGFNYQTDTKIPLSPGTYTYKVTYTPQDIKNYEIVTDIDVEVTILPATYYTITFVDKDNNVLSTQTVRKNRSATEPAITIEEYEANGKNYVFSGWIGNYIDVTSDATITPLYIEEGTSSTYAYVLKPEYYMPENGAGYDSDHYTNALETEGGEKIPLSIKIGGLTEEQANAILNQQTTVVVALGEEEVNKYLTKSTKEQLAAITKGTDATGPYTIEWYVLKYQPDGWHLDGYKVYDTLELDVSYNFSTNQISYSHLAFNFNNAINDISIKINGIEKNVINSANSEDIGNQYIISYTKSNVERTINVTYKFKNNEYSKTYTITDDEIIELNQNKLKMSLPINYSLKNN